MTEPDALQQLASVIQDNATLKRMLRITEPFLRREMYDSLKPHLSFKPKPYLLLK